MLWSKRQEIHLSFMLIVNRKENNNSIVHSWAMQIDKTELFLMPRVLNSD